MSPHKDGVQFLGETTSEILHSRSSSDPGNDNWERKKRCRIGLLRWGIKPSIIVQTATVIRGGNFLAHGSLLRSLSCELDWP